MPCVCPGLKCRKQTLRRLALAFRVLQALLNQQGRRFKKDKLPRSVSKDVIQMLGFWEIVDLVSLFVFSGRF